MNWIFLLVAISGGEMRLEEPRMFASQAECTSYGKLVTSTRPNWLFQCVNITQIGGTAI